MRLSGWETSSVVGKKTRAAAGIWGLSVLPAGVLAVICPFTHACTFPVGATVVRN